MAYDSIDDSVSLVARLGEIIDRMAIYNDSRHKGTFSIFLFDDQNQSMKVTFRIHQNSKNSRTIFCLNW